MPRTHSLTHSLTHKASVWSCIVTLNLGQCHHIRELTIETIIAAIAPTLRRLGLRSCNQITPAGFERLLSLVDSQLQLLDIRGCTQLRRAAFMAVARCCPHLETFRSAHVSPDAQSHDRQKDMQQAWWACRDDLCAIAPVGGRGGEMVS